MGLGTSIKTTIVRNRQQLLMRNEAGNGCTDCSA